MESNLIKGLAVLLAVFGYCYGNGRMYDPPSRASAWRFGFDTPIDYNDNHGFCGGFDHQWGTQDGKCGICGDPWDMDPRAHEVGGLYATGTIVREYTEGQILTTEIYISANHLGHFEFRLCPNPDPLEATQECLDSNRLELADGTGVDYNLGTQSGHLFIDYLLPAGLNCEHCVLQWRYESATNWGMCPNGTYGRGCGPQEEFRACADITILPV